MTRATVEAPAMLFFTEHRGALTPSQQGSDADEAAHKRRRTRRMERAREGRYRAEAIRKG